MRRIAVLSRVKGGASTEQTAPARVALDFEATVGPLYPALVRRLTLVVRDPDEGQDLAQAAYLRAFESWDRFDGRDVRAWLYTIGLRLALNELRRRRRWLRAIARDSAEEFAPPAEPDLWRALGEVDRRHRAAFLLHVLDGYTHAEVGAMLGAPPGTVGSWISRTKERLRRMLREDRDG